MYYKCIIVDSPEIEVWEEVDISDLDSIFVPGTSRCESNSTQGCSPVHSILLWLVYFLAFLQKKHYIPDTALALLLRFLGIFFFVLSRISPQLLELSQSFPSTLHQMDKLIGSKKDGFIRYAVCSSCFSIYSIESCIAPSGSPILCKKKISVRKPSCNTQLLKRVEIANKKVVFHPIKVYCYKRLQDSLQLLLQRPGFYDDCEEVRNHRRKDNLFRDVFDGNLWNEFKNYKGKPFLSEPFTYGLMLNVDWFNPFKHAVYSLGALYLTVMNLPRSKRYKQENVILVGLIPGPSEPPLNINSFLAPLVDELLHFWDGIHMTVANFSEAKLIRCALLCVACDIPASRKVSGFLGHTANQGCSKCMKSFPGSVGQKDYSGFDREKWVQRTVQSHRQNVDEILSTSLKTEKAKLETKYGCRYSALLDLPYFDPVRMTIIDPLHNLFLGSAKHILKRVWIENDLIPKKKFSHIQTLVDKVANCSIPPRKNSK